MQVGDRVQAITPAGVLTGVVRRVLSPAVPHPVLVEFPDLTVETEGYDALRHRRHLRVRQRRPSEPAYWCWCALDEVRVIEEVAA